MAFIRFVLFFSVWLFMVTTSSAADGRPIKGIVKDAQTGKIIADLHYNRQSVMVAKGGRGGRGNACFATAQKRAPQFCEPGEPSIERELELELKLIADVGLLGMPNAGKSTLINDIFDDEITKSGLISEKNQRGKNTTTSTYLYKINENTYLADTPGFSTFDISEIASEDLYKYFIEFVQPSENCEFVGCTHIKEENCGIKEAVQEGKISTERYDRFCKIYLDLKEKENRRW